MAARDALTDRAGAAVATAAAAATPVLVRVAGGSSPTDRAPSRVGVFPGTFDPLTRAHTAVADAALRDGCDLVLFVVPVVSVDKEHLAADADDAVRRLVDVSRWTESTDGAYGSAATNAGLYVDLAAAAAAAFPHAHVDLVCGADKVAQIFDPSYYDGELDDVLDALFARAGVLAVPRGDVVTVDDPRVRWVDADPAVRHDSATEVRTRRASGEDVSHLLP